MCLNKGCKDRPRTLHNYKFQKVRQTNLGENTHLLAAKRILLFYLVHNYLVFFFQAKITNELHTSQLNFAYDSTIGRLTQSRTLGKRMVNGI